MILSLILRLREYLMYSPEESQNYKICHLELMMNAETCICIYNVLYFLAFPEWVEHINDTEVDIGSDLYWPCVATGKPIPTIRWLKNGYSVCVFKCFAVLEPMFR